MMTFKQYASRCGISYEAVRQLCRTHAEELQGHIHKQGRTRVLDDEAVTLLDAVRSNNPVVVLQVSRDEELQALRDENKALLLQVASLQAELLREKDTVKQLQAAEVARLQAANEEKPKGFWARLFGG